MHKVIHQSDVESLPVNMEGASETRIQWLIHEPDGAENFYMRRFTINPGGHSPRHSHPYEHEIYILSGTGNALVDGKWYEISRDFVIFVPPDVEHQIKNTGAEPLVFLCLVPKT